MTIKEISTPKIYLPVCELKVVIGVFMELEVELLVELVVMAVSGCILIYLPVCELRVVIAVFYGIRSRIAGRTGHFGSLGLYTYLLYIEYFRY